jgi:transmembrane sensor
MTDSRSPLDELGRLKRHLSPELDLDDVERLVRGAAGRRQRRRSRQTLAAGLLLGVLSTTIVVFVLRWSAGGSAAGRVTAQSAAEAASAIGSSAPAAARDRGTPHVLSLSDRSRAIPLEPGTELALEEDVPERVHLRLDRGRARFEVTRRPERSFSVRARNVTVSVVGTTFGVEVVADRVGVSVEKGAVEVDWGVGQKRLLAGESGWFPPLVMSGHPEPEGAESAARVAAEPPPVIVPSSAPRAPASDAQALLAEVDAVRSQGKPARAVELLRQLLREYPDDPRAPLAAFTLGRVLFNELGRPREAAAAFRQVRQKSPAGQFAEDALAREVEAWERASEPDRARSLAAEYLERYPNGRHARRVKALVGSE